MNMKLLRLIGLFMLVLSIALSFFNNIHLWKDFIISTMVGRTVIQTIVMSGLTILGIALYLIGVYGNE